MSDETTDTTTPEDVAWERVLSDEILADAQREAEQARERGEREARQSLRQATGRAAEDAAKTLEAAQERADRLQVALMATVQSEAQRDLLDAREAQLETLFEAARRRLADRASYDYPAVLAALTAQAIEAMGVDEVVIELAEADGAIASVEWLETVWRRLGRNVTIDVSGTAAPIDGGVIVRSADGRLLYDNSFRARLERLKPELRRELAAMLYSEAQASG